MAKAHYLSDKDGKFYPYAHTQATYDKDGNILETRLGTIEGALDDIPTNLSDLQDDTTHRTVTDDEKTAWDGKYDIPETGIPANDLAVPVVYSGTSTPSTTLGKNGDIYFVIPS